MHALGSVLPAALLYFSVVLGLGELLRRVLHLPTDVSRKLVLAALSAFAIPALYWWRDPSGAALAYLILAVVLYLSFRYEIFAALEDEGPAFGSVLAPLSVSLLLRVVGRALPQVAVAAVLAMAVGDGLAALVGRRRGTRKYRILGHPRTMEGTLALFLGSSAAAAPALALLGGLDWHQAVAFALIGGTVAASVETVSVYGSDNLTVPLATAATLVALLRASA